MVMTLAAQAALTPEGNPVAVPMPVAPVVACVIFVNAVLIHSVGVLDAAPAVLALVINAPETALVTAVPQVPETTQ